MTDPLAFSVHLFLENISVTKACWRMKY
jgi:hypothetical protein